MGQAVEVHIRGIVQGVGYRYFCLRKAKSLRVTGTVTNNPDGSVTVIAEAERSLLEILVDELKIGPSSATVTTVDINWRQPTGEFNDFTIGG